MILRGIHVFTSRQLRREMSIFLASLKRKDVKPNEKGN
ncbi:hypothetical protein B4070_2532 [Bacillus subtilis]|nr:hypothetical protein B4070_2532 [Bacillus subtilis]